MSQIKQFKHLASGVIHDYVDGHTLEGHAVTMLYSKGVWHTVGTEEFDELVQCGVIELIEEEEM